VVAEVLLELPLAVLVVVVAAEDILPLLVDLDLELGLEQQIQTLHQQGGALMVVMVSLMVLETLMVEVVEVLEKQEFQHLREMVEEVEMV